MKKKITKRKLQAMETRKNIYESARKLFSQYGYEAVSIDDIVQEAGVARGSFYVYFLSKEDLSVYLMSDELNLYREQIEKSWAALDKSLPAVELIVQTACGICAMVESWGVETMRTVYKIFIERAGATGITYKSMFEMPEVFITLYELGISRKELMPACTELIAENIQTILVGVTYQWCLYYPNYDFTGRAKALIAEYLNGFKVL